MQTDSSSSLRGYFSHGVDFANAECHLWPAAARLSLWGDSTRVTLAATNSSHSTLHKPSTLAFRLTFVRFYFFLKQLGVGAADMTLVPTMPHVSTKLKWKDASVPLKIVLKYEVSSLWHIMHHNVSSTGRYRLLAQCPSIADHIRRPIVEGHRKSIHMAFLNVADGGRDRSPAVQEFLSQQANQGVAFIGMCELNGWHAMTADHNERHIPAYTGVNKAVTVSNSKKGATRPPPDTEHSGNTLIKKKAALAGFAFSFVTEIPHQPYNLGLVAAVPFEVVAVHGPPIFQRGCVHVYFAGLQLHAFITHLHAHNSSLRVEETQFLSSLIKPLIEKQMDKVVVMGDMNSLFGGDVNYHHNWVSLFETHPHPTVQRLKQKFCDNNSSQINYQPLQNLVDVGLRDSCTAYCQAERSAGTHRANENLDFKTCHMKHCAYSEPTLFNPEVSAGSHTSNRARGDTTPCTARVN